MAFRTKPILALAFTLVGGCALRHTSGDSDAVNEGADTEGTETNVEALSTSLATGPGSGGEALVISPPTSFGAGCLTVTNDGAAKRLTYLLADCTGPYGLVHVTGTVTVDYDSPAAGETTLAYAATGLRVNGAVVDWTAAADLKAKGDARVMTWDGHFKGTTANGRAIERTNQKTYQWQVGVPCLSASGTSDGTVTGDELRVNVVSYSRCAHECPEAGSEVQVTDVTRGATYDLRYGASTATFTGPSGGQVIFTPLCAR